MIRGELLHTFFAHAGACCRALTSFELGIALADNVQRAFALHDLTIGVTALH